MPDPILDNLTDAQREAVTHVEGPMLVVAGAGSGKTRVVTRRIAHLIRQGARPNQILAMTFTNKAASEMKQRVEELVGAAPRWVGTFHSACARFLRFDLDKLAEGRTGQFSIYDDTDQQGVIRQITKDLNIDDKRFTPRSVLSRISRSKCDGIGPDEYSGGSWDDEMVAKVYAEYEWRLRNMNAVDFDDLLLLTVKMLKNVPKLREMYLERFRYLLIDEYQDTNRIQYNLMRLLTGASCNVHVTGDPDQSIYSWRGADYNNIMDFQKDFPEARLVRLEQNYRSTKTIVAAANSVIRFNTHRIEKDLFTENAEGGKITVAALPGDRDEAGWVAETIADLNAAGRERKDIAIFYRTNAQSRPFEEAFMTRAIPYQIVGGVRFYQRKEIKDILAHLKLLVNPRDVVNLARVIGCRATGVGAKTLDTLLLQSAERKVTPFDFLRRVDFPTLFTGRVTKKLKDFARWCCRLGEIPQQPVAECVRMILEHSGLKLEIMSKAESDPASRDRIDNLEAFMNRATEFQGDHPAAALPQFLEEVALVADIDSFEEEADVVSLMTLHSAKGLEFPIVFLVGLEDGLLPHSNSKETGKEALEEERRLFYVGLTRTQEQVYITHARTRMMWGSINVAAPSPFLEEMLPETVEEINLADPLAAPMDDDDDFPWGSSPSIAKKSRKKKARGDWDALDFMDDDVDPDDPFPADDFAPASAERVPTLRPGDLVEHTTFGRGKILSLSRNRAVVQFFIGGTKMLQLGAAPLRKVR